MTYVIICVVSSLISIGFTIGVMISKYQTNIKCEHNRHLRDQHRSRQEDEYNRRLEKLEAEWNESLKRVHIRLDEVLLKLTRNP